VMIANFIANSGGYYFASDIGNLLTGATGNVASNGGVSIVPVTPVIPEPPSLLLLGTGLLVLAGAFKAKLLLA
ncbi:MAG: PEP-CTERM sorting domain-containing protein, partial [Acidobacteriaceae bacterium]